MLLAGYHCAVHELAEAHKARLTAGKLYRPAKTGAVKVLLFPGDGAPAKVVDVQQGPDARSCMEGDFMMESLVRTLLAEVDPQRFPKLYALAGYGRSLSATLLVARDVHMDDGLAGVFGFQPKAYGYYLGDAMHE